MRAIIQRVLSSSVTVDQNVVGAIDKGLCVLVGITQEDTKKDMDFIIKKILSLRLFEDEQGKAWAKSVKYCDFEILCGSKPDFHKAAKADFSKDFYHEFLSELKKAYIPEKIKDGVFGAMMQVQINNDGPVTIILDSQK